MTTLRLGSKGEDVKVLQRALGLSDDGIFGVKTDALVRAFQVKHGLTADGIVGAKTWAALGITDTADINILKAPISVHITKCATRMPKYIVIHYTAGASSRKGSARGERNVFLSRSASADFVVDDAEIVQINPDIAHYYCWSVGDNGGGKYIKNANSVNIEICSNLKKGYSALYPNHDGWYFTDASLNNALKLVRYLMKLYKIPKENVVRHFDVTKKLCPGIIGWNTGSILDQKSGKVVGKDTEEKWLEFKARL